jgi:radical SAM superfamily enzyme YgiQ (UPF0313 family)
LLCSFCTIISVHGRTSRFRSADDVERIIRRNVAQGITSFLIADDNCARNRNHAAMLDRLIALREGQGLPIRFSIHIDTVSYKIKHFIEVRARRRQPPISRARKPISWGAMPQPRSLTREMSSLPTRL